MSSTNSQTNTSKEDNKEAPPKPEETLPAFEKELTDRIVNQFSGDAEVGYVKENRTRINVKKEKILALATRTSREDNPRPGNDSTKLPSLRDVFPSVSFHERECFEMLGVYFDGHPDNRRLLLPEDWADKPPLRKDFALKGR